MFKDILIKWRKSQNMERADLAELLDITYQGLAQLESGKNEPSIKFLKKFSNLSGLTMSELLEERSEESYNYNNRKIRNLAKKLNYNYKDLADDIVEPREELKKIFIDEKYEPPSEIIEAICCKYDIPRYEFSKNDDEYIKFINGDINRGYIEAALKAKKNGLTVEDLEICIDFLIKVRK